MQKRLLARIIILTALAAAAWFVWHRQQTTAPASAPEKTPRTEQENPQSNTKAPSYVLETLRFIRNNGQAPEGFVGGREFQNREKKLPAKTTEGQKIRYSEWDVHPKKQGKSRGAERLVTGSDHSAYYTKDHYKTFLKLD